MTGTTTLEQPRFAWRGLMLDVARHFFPLQTLKAVVDRMALFKLNTLHLHLSDDQGFRLALDKHPELTKVGAFRKENGGVYGGFYTKDDIRELLAYAHSKGIAIVPEIDLPGHTRAVLAAHPELSCTGLVQEVPSTFGIFEDVLCLGNDQTLTLVSDILDEVAELFPSRYVHVGGDEVPTHRWSECAKCRARIEREHLSGVHGLQPWFSKVVTEMVRKHNKIPIAWDEVLTPGSELKTDTVIMAWRGLPEAAGAAAAGYPVVMAPNQFVYLNMPQPGQPMHGATETLSAEKVLSFNWTASAKDDHKGILGGEVALWTEYVHDLTDIDTQLFPRLPILAEGLWSQKPTTDIVSLVRAQLPKLSRLGITYYVEPPSGLYERSAFLDDAEVVLAISPIYDGATIEVQADDGLPFVYKGPFKVTKTTRIRATTVVRDGRRSRVTEGLLTRDRLRPARPPSERVSPPAYTYYEGAFEKVPDFTKLSPTRRGAATTFDLSVATRANDYAIQWSAAIAAPKDGLYTFYVKSDDGALFHVDNELVVDNDGRHAPREKRGQIALAKGVHTVSLGFFQAKGGAYLAVEVTGPDGSRMPLQTFLLPP